MESGNYNTSLMFGVQWDLVLKYLETKGTAQADLKKDSTSWGNYSNNLWNITNENLKYAPNGSGWTSATEKAKVSKSGILLSTGASDDFSKQGIYDLAGNVFEMTLEHANLISRAEVENPCVRRGGCFGGWDGNESPASWRFEMPEIEFNISSGFRVSLY